MPIDYAWRGPFDNPELNGLHTAGFGHRILDADDWWGTVNRHSLGWVTARDEIGLVGFVNVAWDGAAHAFVLDTLVEDRVARTGVGTRLVSAATDGARAAGCEWLHVDFEPHLAGFYLETCRFRSTPAGLIRLC